MVGIRDLHGDNTLNVRAIRLHTRRCFPMATISISTIAKMACGALGISATRFLLQRARSLDLHRTASGPILASTTPPLPEDAFLDRPCNTPPNVPGLNDDQRAARVPFRHDHTA